MHFNWWSFWMKLKSWFLVHVWQCVSIILRSSYWPRNPSSNNGIGSNGSSLVHFCTSDLVSDTSWFQSWLELTSWSYSYRKISGVGSKLPGPDIGWRSVLSGIIAFVNSFKQGWDTGTNAEELGSWKLSLKRTSFGLSKSSNQFLIGHNKWSLSTPLLVVLNSV